MPLGHQPRPPGFVEPAVERWQSIRWSRARTCLAANRLVIWFTCLTCSSPFFSRSGFIVRARSGSYLESSQLGKERPTYAPPIVRRVLPVESSRAIRPLSPSLVSAGPNSLHAELLCLPAHPNIQSRKSRFARNWNAGIGACPVPRDRVADRESSSADQAIWLSHFVLSGDHCLSKPFGDAPEVVRRMHTAHESNNSRWTGARSGFCPQPLSSNQRYRLLPRRVFHFNASQFNHLQSTCVRSLV